MTSNQYDVASAALGRHPRFPHCDPKARRRSRRPSPKIAFLVIGTFAALTACNADDPPASSASTTPATTATRAEEQPRPSHTAVIDAYFVAYNDGDTDAVMSILAPAPIYDEAYDGVRPDPNGGEPVEPADLEAVLAWNHAQGEILTEPDCGLADEQPQEGATLECTYTTLDAVVQAVDGRPIPTESLFTIRDGTITELRHGYGFPDFATLGRPFTQWLDRQHPEVEGADCCAGDSRDESIQRGSLRAEWALEWNRYLEQNGCSPTEPCTPIPDDATSDNTLNQVTVTTTEAIELATEYLAAFATGNPETVLAMQSDDFVMRAGFPGDGLGEQQLTDWLGVVHQATLETSYDEIECTVTDASPSGTVVECETSMVTAIHAQTNTPGVPTKATITVTADGITNLDSRYLQNLGARGFYDWIDLQESAPEDDTEGPATIDDVVELGRLDAALAAEYAEFGVSTVEGVFNTFNAGNLDGFLVQFSDRQLILGVSSENAREAVATLIDAGVRLDASGCTPAGIDSRSLRVDCDVTVVSAPGSTVSEVAGSVTMLVGVDGVIQLNSSTIDLNSILD